MQDDKIRIAGDADGIHAKVRQAFALMPERPPDHLRAMHTLKTADSRKLRAAAAIFPAVPAPGETVFILGNSSVNPYTWAQRLCELISPADELLVSTWDIGPLGVQALIDLHAAGHCRHVAVLVGDYFKSGAKARYLWLMEELRKIKGGYGAFKNHAKLILVSFAAAGHYLVVTGSANFCTNPRDEQYTVTNARPVYEFFRRWFDEHLETSPA